MLNYIATRDGVEIGEISETELLKDEKYLSYIATRPGAVNGEHQSHGLFGKLRGMPDTSDIPELGKTRRYVEGLARDKKTIYNAVISFRGDDAIDKGFDDRQGFVDLLKSQMNEMAREMDIEPRALEWVASVHMEKSHPHVHIMYWDTEQEIGVNYIKAKKSDNIRQKLTNDIFREELKPIRKEKDIAKKEMLDEVFRNNDSILKNSLNVFKGMSIDEIYRLSQNFRDETTKLLDRKAAQKNVDYLETALYDLRKTIKEIYEEGSFKYQFLPKKLKNQIDDISEWLISNNNDLKCEFKNFMDAAETQSKFFGGAKNATKYLNAQKRDLFKDIGNRILQVTKQLDFLDDDFNIKDNQSSSLKLNKLEADSADFHMSWNQAYKEAKSYMYSTADESPDFEKAFEMLIAEDEIGNVLATFDLGNMYANGMVDDADMDIAQEYYTKAFQGFISIEDEKSTAYTEYRIGKMYLSGLGVEADTSQAADWLEQASEKGNKYAQYTLAGLYKIGDGVKKDSALALKLYSDSASKSFPYASFELGKMYHDGIGTEKDEAISEKHFADAFIGFINMEERSHDDKLQYRLGCMLENGIGTEPDIDKAVEFFQKSATAGNMFACYHLAKLILNNEDSNTNEIENAIKLLKKSAEGKNQFAQYTLAKLLLTGSIVEKNTEAAVQLFIEAAEQGNEYAQYKLGCLYLDGELVEQDIAKALDLLTKSAEQENGYAQYKLGCLYLNGELVEQDIAKALDLLTKSAEQENGYAQYKLGCLYLDGKLVEHDAGKAIKMLTLSSEQNNEFAQYRLGKLFLKSMPPYKNVPEAIRLLTLSAEQGNQYAQCTLGIELLSGSNVKRNNELANYWLKKAANQGNQFAKKILANLAMFKLQLIIGLMQPILNIISQNTSKQKYHSHKDMSKAEKAEASRKHHHESEISWER